MCNEVINIRAIRRALAIVATLFCVSAWPTEASAQLTPPDRLCEPGAEDCRQILINHIRAEKVGLDVGFWFMEDHWIAAEVIARWNAKVPVRIIMDSRANASYRRNIDRLAEFQAAGIPMRERFAAGILHWKMMLFAGQGLVEFSGANFSSDAWVPAGPPYTNYVDEGIYFSTKPSVVSTFKSKFDDLWTNTTSYRDYANITGTPTRNYGPAITTPDPELNFPPNESYAVRSLNEYYRETRQIDAIMYRITDRRHTDAMIDLRQRGMTIRLITEPMQYREPSRPWHSWNVDRLYMAGVQIMHRKHAGLNHQKSVLLHGLGMTIFGSSNWTSPSAHSQEEHNYFTRDPQIFSWFVDQFERKWTNSAGVEENIPFQPLPPDPPSTPVPAHQATNVPTSNLTLHWYGSPWAHEYDVYLGTSPSAMSLVAEKLQLGPSEWSGHLKSFTVRTPIQPGTMYHWRVVGRTMANLTATSPTWTFTTDPAAPAPADLQSPWSAQDVGSTALAGSAKETDGVFTVRGAGDIWGTADAFQFAWRPMTGDVDIVARVAAFDATQPGAKTGVMIRESMAPGSAHALMLVSRSSGLYFHRRAVTDGATVFTAGAATGAPAWVKLERRGNTITGYTSADGATWTLVGSQAFTMGSAVRVGLVAASQDTTRLATATFDNVTVTQVGVPTNVAPTVALTAPAGGATFTAPASVNVAATATDSDGTVAQVQFFAGSTLIGTDASSPFAATWSNVPAGTYSLTARATDNAGAVTTSAAVTVTVTTGTPPAGLPTPWLSQDIGAVGAAGSATASGGTFTARGSGADVWGAADGLHYVHQQVTGDVDIVARVPTVEYVHAWTKAGVMIRGALSADAAHGFMVVSPAKGLAFQRRPLAGGASVNTSGGTGTAPAWVKLERRGNTITAYRSDNGTTWTLVGSDTIQLPATAYVGLAISSHDNTRVAAATFSDVTVTSPTVIEPHGNAPPTVSLTSPSNGTSVTAPATIVVTATASDPDGTIARVDFYAGTTLIGTAAASPYQVTWTNVPAGAYTLTARAFDNADGVANSSAVSVTVTEPAPPANAPPTVALTSPSNGTSATAPATIALAASATDSDGMVARVEFYAGTTLIGTVSASPFEMSWTSVAVGSYSITARAVDNTGAVTTSTAVSITVTDPVPTSPWTSQDIGAVGARGSMSESGGALTLKASGADVWGAADGFHYAHQQMTGDFDIFARVASVEYVHAWTKAGVMIRDGLTADAAHGFMLVSPAKGLAFQRRVGAGGLSTNTAGGTGTAPAWVKLERRGTTITAFTSPDGVTWTLVGSDTFSMGPTVYVGLALTSHDNTRVATALFDGVTITAR